MPPARPTLGWLSLPLHVRRVCGAAAAVVNRRHRACGPSICPTACADRSARLGRPLPLPVCLHARAAHAGRLTAQRAQLRLLCHLLRRLQRPRRQRPQACKSPCCPAVSWPPGVLLPIRTGTGCAELSVGCAERPVRRVAIVSGKGWARGVVDQRSSDLGLCGALHPSAPTAAGGSTPIGKCLPQPLQGVRRARQAKPDPTAFCKRSSCCHKTLSGIA